jgi:hypothetical protein
MTYLSYAQLRAYAAAAGAADPDTAAAVALAETDGTGDSKAHNPIPPDDSYGPWQINMLGPLGPDRRKKLGITSNTQLYDPLVNARAMVMISSGGSNFRPWTTYTSGKYKKYLKGATAAPGGTSGTPPVEQAGLSDVGGAIAAPFKDIASITVDFSNWVVNPSNWLRVLYVIAGASVTLVGLGVLAQGTALGNAAKQVALGAKGKAAGALKTTTKTTGKTAGKAAGKAPAAPAAPTGGGST